jgi:hypothetical protein
MVTALPLAWVPVGFRTREHARAVGAEQCPVTVRR